MVRALSADRVLQENAAATPKLSGRSCNTPVAGSHTLVRRTQGWLGISYLGLTSLEGSCALLGRCSPTANITSSAAISLLTELACGSAACASFKRLRLTLQPQCC